MEPFHAAKQFKIVAVFLGLVLGVFLSANSFTKSSESMMRLQEEHAHLQNELANLRATHITTLKMCAEQQQPLDEMRSESTESLS